MSNFNPGDKVSFLNEQGTAEVISLLERGKALVRDEYGFERTVALSELVPRASREDYKVSFAFLATKEERTVTPPKLEKDEVWEVDLHLDNLPGFPTGKGDHEKLLFQIRYFKKCMDAAMLNRIRKVIFIHGVGKGTLKAELIHALGNYEGVEYYDAPFRKYGFGALVVEL